MSTSGGKATLVNLEGGGTFTFQYNPKEFKVDKADSWKEHDDQGQTNAGLEFQKGAFGYNGYLMDMRGLKKGVYSGNYTVWYAPPGFKKGDEKQYIWERTHPIKAKATQ